MCYVTAGVYSLEQQNAGPAHAGLCHASVTQHEWSGSPASDVRKNKEDPAVDKQHQENVEKELADDLLTQVECSVNYDQHELGKKHR